MSLKDSSSSSEDGRPFEEVDKLNSTLLTNNAVSRYLVLFA